MMPHLRYLRYVLLHKLYVFRAGVVIGGWSLPWLWRLLVHDLSKFSRAEWTPYVATFYGPKAVADAAERSRRFKAAWLHHIHANPHHWQHWLLQQDDGKTIVLVPPNAVVNEMIADWLGAGQKILANPSMTVCVAETIVWYANNSKVMQLRQPVRDHVELVLHSLARVYGLHYLIPQLDATRASRRSLVVGAGD